MHGAVRGGRQSRVQTVGMTGHTPSRNGTSRLVQLQVVTREPGRAEYSRSNRRGDEEQVNHLSVVARHDQSERFHPVCQTSDGFAVKVQDGSWFNDQTIKTIIGAGVDQKRGREGGSRGPTVTCQGEPCGRTKGSRRRLRSPALLRALESSLFWPRGTGSDKVVQLPPVQRGLDSNSPPSLRGSEPGSANLHQFTPDRRDNRQSRRNRQMQWFKSQG